MSKNFIAMCAVLCFVLVSLGGSYERAGEQVIIYVNCPLLEPPGFGGTPMPTQDPDVLKEKIKESMQENPGFKVISVSVDIHPQGGRNYYNGAWIVYEKR